MKSDGRLEAQSAMIMLLRIDLWSAKYRIAQLEERLKKAGDDA